LVGRDRAVAEVAGVLTESRLVTLCGPGGCGKTRLAIAVATEVADAFVDGVWWVELAAVAEPAGVAQTIAAVLRIREHPSRSLIETLCDQLRLSDALLVLDNCEHVVDMCASLVWALLAACARLRIMATSREPLQVNGERTWLVPVRLLVERVAAVEPGFTLTADNARAVALVCHRLDGIPLAIELTNTRSPP
jgi:predicted ATPase